MVIKIKLSYFTCKNNFTELITHIVGYTVTEFCRVILPDGFDFLKKQRFSPSSMLEIMYS